MTAPILDATRTYEVHPTILTDEALTLSGDETAAYWHALHPDHLEARHALQAERDANPGQLWERLAEHATAREDQDGARLAVARAKLATWHTTHRHNFTMSEAHAFYTQARKLRGLIEVLEWKARQ